MLTSLWIGSAEKSTLLKTLLKKSVAERASSQMHKPEISHKLQPASKVISNCILEFSSYLCNKIISPGNQFVMQFYIVFIVIGYSSKVAKEL